MKGCSLQTPGALGFEALCVSIILCFQLSLFLTFKLARIACLHTQKKCYACQRGRMLCMYRRGIRGYFHPKYNISQRFMFARYTYFTKRVTDMPCLIWFDWLLDGWVLANPFETKCGLHQIVWKGS